jgi:hypothetical protein
MLLVLVNDRGDDSFTVRVRLERICRTMTHHPMVLERLSDVIHDRRHHEPTSSEQRDRTSIVLEVKAAAGTIQGISLTDCELKID